jgi:hypothetical protein
MKHNSKTTASLQEAEENINLRRFNVLDMTTESTPFSRSSVKTSVELLAEKPSFLKISANAER